MNILHKRSNCILMFSMLLCVGCANQGRIQKSNQTNTTENQVDLYVLIGQSNMAGRGEIDSLSKTCYSKDVLVLTKAGVWETAQHPLHFDKPIAAVGPGLMFGSELAKQTSHKIGLVPCAVGGSSISVWRPGAFDVATKTHPYNDAINRINIAMKTGTLKGIIWHQGESDRLTYTHEAYLNELTELINRLRVVAGNPELPFIAGELGYFVKDTEAFNKNLHRLPMMIKNTAVVSAEGLTHKGDDLHFNSRSAELLGKRYAAAMLELQSR
jgi:hypothetical protein